MIKQKRILALMLVMAVVLLSFAACTPRYARKPATDNTDGYMNYTGQNTRNTDDYANYTKHDIPNTTQNNQNYQRNVGSNTNANSTGQISSSYSNLDYSFATITDNINMRSGSNADSPITGRLKDGEQVKVIGKLNGWYVVNVPGTNKVGCVNPKYANLYSAQPGTTKPAPTKKVPATPTTPTTPRTTTGTNTPGTTTGANTPATPTGAGTLTAQGSRILQLANAERAKVGAKPLKSNTELNKLATMKSQDIVEKNYFSHQSPTYGSPFDMMKTYGVQYMYAGENLAINQDADKAHNAWMNSEGHKRNILNPDFTEIGIGLYPKGNGSYAYTQMFIGK